MNIAIYLYNDAEVLDFSGPFEVFTTANRVCSNQKNKQEPDPFEVFLISELGGEVVARAGYTVKANYAFHNHPKIDVLIVVGGLHTHELEKPQVIEWIATQSAQASLVASVCTGAFLLAKAGILTNQKVTTHWEDIGNLQAMFPKLNTIKDVRWVDEGKVITSGGISAGIDMSLHLVSKLHSLELAKNTAKQMAFSWTKNKS